MAVRPSRKGGSLPSSGCRASRRRCAPVSSCLVRAPPLSRGRPISPRARRTCERPPAALPRRRREATSFHSLVHALADRGLHPPVERRAAEIAPPLPRRAARDGPACARGGRHGQAAAASARIGSRHRQGAPIACRLGGLGACPPMATVLSGGKLPACGGCPWPAARASRGRPRLPIGVRRDRPGIRPPDLRRVSLYCACRC